jgi:hypothetical protein
MTLSGTQGDLVVCFASASATDSIVGGLRRGVHGALSLLGGRPWRESLVEAGELGCGCVAQGRLAAGVSGGDGLSGEKMRRCTGRCCEKL